MKGRYGWKKGVRFICPHLINEPDPFSLVSPIDDPIIAAAAWAEPDFRGECTVYAHGAWTHITDSRNTKANKVRYLANDPQSMKAFNALMGQLGCQKDQPVVLKSCETGANPEEAGKKNVLGALSEIRQTPVTAPTKSIWSTLNGVIPTPYGHMNNDFNAPINPNDPGQYNTVYP